MERRSLFDLDRPSSALAVSLATGLAMLAWTWGTWLDPLIDFGRELYLPWRIVEGQTLYRDLASFNGPLSPYLNAGWFTIFGVGIRSLVIGNAFILTLLALLIYRLTKSMADRRTAAASVVFFLLVFAFGEYDQVGNYNYLTPYSHELVHGIVLSFASLACLFSILDRPTWRPALLGGLFAGLTFLTKPEVFAALMMALAAGALAAIVRRRIGGDVRLGHAAAWGAGMLLPPIVVILALSRRAPIESVLNGLLDPYVFLSNATLRSQTFYRNMSGLADPMMSLGEILPSLMVWLSAIVALVVLTWSKLVRRWRAEAIVAAAFVGFLVAIAFNKAIVDQIARPLPFLMAGIAVVLIRKVANRDGVEANAEAKRLAFVSFALVLTIKMVLNAHVRGYGFALMMPASITMVMALLHWLPQTLERRKRDGGIVRIVSGGWALAIASVFLLAHAERVRAMTAPVSSGPDRFLTDERSLPVNAALDILARSTSATDRVVVLPEGIMLNYLARRASSLPYTNFLPPEAIMYGEDRLLKALTDNPPEFIVVVQRPLREYGYRGFGIDYAKPMADWVTSHYEVVAKMDGPATMAGAFGMQILRRTQAGVPEGR